MSTKDISRFLFQPQKHYVGMRMQQGRVLMDSDHNEGAWHDDEDQRRTLVELIGPHGTPDGGFFIGYVSSDGMGGTPQPITLGVPVGTTSIEFNDDGTEVQVPNYYVMPGSMYVGGLRVEMEEPEHIAFQSDFLQNTPAAGDIPSDLSSSSTVAHHFFFLNVWEQCVTAVEDEEILERALGGPDTSVRVRRMRKVEFLLAEDGEDCVSALERALSEATGGMGEFDRQTGELRSPGRLRIDFVSGDTEDTCAPCHPDPTGRYLGAENQAIRIMLVDPTHFVWAYDNASPLYRVTIGGVGDAPADDPLVTMLTLPKDEEHWPLEGRVVEILPWSAVLPNGEKVADEIGVFCRVSRSFKPDGTDAKTFLIDKDDASAMAALNDLVRAWDNDHPRLPDLNPGTEPRHFYVRFWHQTSASTSVLIPTTSTASLGSTGLVPVFTEPGLRGDYWIAAMRPETPDVTVPFDLHDEPAGVPPHGPRHFYAPIAMVHSANNVVTGVEDCRKHILPAVDQGCCTVVVGDGVHSFGQFTSIQAAIDALPPQGGEVCVRPGVYREEIVIHDRNNVVLQGCGDHTILESPSSTAADSVIEVRNVFNVAVRSLTVRSTGQRSLWVHSGNTIRLKDIKAEAVPTSGSSTDDDPVVFVHDVGSVTLENLDIAASRRTGLQIQGTGYDDPARLLRIRVRGEADSTLAPPTGPLTVIRWGVFSIEDCRFEAYGQYAIEGQSLSAEVRRCTFICDHFSPDARAKAAIEWEYVFIKVEDSTFDLRTRAFSGFEPISEHAAISVWGTMLFQNNFVKASPRFWGGVHVRTGGGQNGGSSLPNEVKLPTTIRGNRIVGGAGHGITLGYVSWTGPSGAPSIGHAPGIGQMFSDGQVTGNLRNGVTVNGFHYTARHGIPLGALEIVDNSIESMGTNGISVVTLFGMPSTERALTALNEPCRIRGNRIVRNLRNASSAIPVNEPLLPIGGSRFGSLPGHNAPLRLLPLGGIVLGGADNTSGVQTPPLNLEICDNVIEDNTPTDRTLPVCGILVLAGDSVTISGNQIARNGSVPQSGDALQTGLRAGIAVLLAGARVGTLDQIQAFLNDSLVRPPGRYSLHVSGNTVEQPEGRALFAVGTGPMTIENNFFSSLGFHGSTLSPEALADIFAIGDVVYVHNLGRPWESFGLPMDAPTNGLPPNNFPVGGASGPIAYLKNMLGSWSYAVDDVFFVGLGGQTLFADNQVVYDWTLRRVGSDSLSYAPVALVSNDHVGVRSNQFGFRLQTGSFTLPTPPLPPPPVGSTQGFGGRPVLTHVLTVGYTVDVSGNRVSEGFGICEASIFSIGFVMNSTTQNIGTHCIIPEILASDSGVVASSNITFISPANGCTSLQGALTGLMNEFSLLLEDRRQ